MIDRHPRLARPLALVCCLALSTGCTAVPGNSWALLPKGGSAQPGAESPGSVARTSAPPELSSELANGRNLERAGKYDEARAVYQRLVAAYPKRAEPYHRLGVVADQQRRHREAQALYAEAIRLDGANAELFNDLGYCLYLQGQLPKAEVALLKAVTLRPASSRCRNNLGLVLAHEGRVDEAFEQFRRGGSEADAYYNLAFVYASQDDVARARECLGRALAAEPGYEPARRALDAFDRYDEDPDGVAAAATFAADGVRWVPYIEGGGPEATEGTTSATGGNLDRATAGAPSGPNTQSLLKQARSMMAQRGPQQQE